MKNTENTKKFYYFVFNDDYFGSGETPEEAGEDFYRRSGHSYGEECFWMKGKIISVALQEVITQTLVEE